MIKGLIHRITTFILFQNRICYSPLYRLRFELQIILFKWINNQGYFLFPETRLGPFQDEFEKTLDAYDSDEINNDQITSTNSGVLPQTCSWHHWYSRSSGICICALYAAILANVHLQRHQDAVILIDKILTYNPENNQGTRWLLGAELLLRAGKHGRGCTYWQDMSMNFPLLVRACSFTFYEWGIY